MSIIAKKRDDGNTQTLVEHTECVLNEAFKNIDQKYLKYVSEACKIEEELLLDIIFYCAYFHDIGKATVEFQRTIENNTRSFHGLYSAALTIDIHKFFLNSGNDIECINFLFLVVLTHHSIFISDSPFKCINKGSTYKHTFLPEAETFFNNHKHYYYKYRKKNCSYHDFTYPEYTLDELDGYINDCIYNPIYLNSDYEKLKLLYNYVHGIINLSDWIASAKFSGNIPKTRFLDLPDKPLLLNAFKYSINKRKKQNSEEFIPRRFQEDMSSKKGNILIEIPTGEGKTEGAFLWAVKNIRNEYSKIIYTLPTQTTSNKLHDRAKDLFHDLTGLIHGSASIYLEKAFEEENGTINDDFRSDLLFNKNFAKPVTISTIDGLFKFYINLGRYSMALKNIHNSVIIIDEVHSYDLKLMGFMKKFLEIVSLQKIPVCIMSASIPNKVKELLGINTWHTITEPKLFENKAINIIKQDVYLDDELEEIVDMYRQGKSVLVVRNTVKLSKKTYRKLVEYIGEENKDKIILYNSEFKKKDRIKKEETIYDKLENKENYILVATQVVEVSLDIDFDVMFTDLAPIDALIQRFGRVNRSKDISRIANVYIYKFDGTKPYESEILDYSYEEIEEGIHPIKQYTVWLNNVYDKVYIDKKHINKKASFFYKGYETYEELLKKFKGIEKNTGNYELRHIEIPKDDFLLYDDYMNDNQNFENTIALPLYYLKSKKEFSYKEKNYDKGIKYNVLNLDYNFDEGIIITKNNDIEFY